MPQAVAPESMIRDKPRGLTANNLRRRLSRRSGGEPDERGTGWRRRAGHPAAGTSRGFADGRELIAGPYAQRRERVGVRRSSVA